MIFKEKCFLKIFCFGLCFCVVFGEDLKEGVSESLRDDLTKTDSEKKLIFTANATEKGLFGSLSPAQRCVTNEGRPGLCKPGVCLYLIDKKPVYCQSSSSYHMKCCPSTARSAVLMPTDPSMSFIDILSEINI